MRILEILHEREELLCMDVLKHSNLEFVHFRVGIGQVLINLDLDDVTLIDIVYLIIG